MNIAPLAEVQFGSEAQLRDMLDINALAHETLFTYLLSHGVIVAHHPLFTMGEDRPGWLQLHAQEHDGFSDGLAIARAVNLNQVDFDDRGQFNDWVQRHSLHHTQLAIAAGL